MNKQMKAFSQFEIKAVDEEQGIIRGIASTPSTDRMGDILEPKGAVFTLPMPLLWQHAHDEPIGQVIEATVTDEGISIVAQVAKDLTSRIQTYWQLIKANLVRGLSVGFRALEYEVIKETGGYRVTKWDWYELSPVTVPANQDATIQVIKSLASQPAAPGDTADPPKESPTPGDSGMKNQPATKQVFLRPKQKETKMTLQEQIKAFEAKRAAHAARMEELVQKAADEGRSFDETEAEEFDNIKAEVKSIDDQLVRVRELEKINMATAKPVDGSSAKAASDSRAGIITLKSNVPKGTAFTRYAIALARAKGNLMQAAEIAKSWHDSTPQVETILKAAVAAGTTTDPAWAGNLVDYQNMAGEFIELLRPQTIIGRIPNLRRVPFNIRMPGQTAGSTVGWVGEGKPKPVSALAFDTTTLRFTKCAGIVVLTDELVRFSNPSAEAIVQQDLTAAIAQFLDQQFIDPAVAEVANVSPASITNGVTAIPASGTDVDALRADVKKVFAAFIAANLTPANGVWIMSNTTALAISLMQNALGQPEFPGMTMNGGTFFGLPAITSETAGDKIILLNASDILLADEGGVTLDVSREASLQMDSAPADGVAELMSLWQNNMVGLRAERYINWKRRRNAAVQYISGANYGDTTVTPGP